MSDTDSNYHDTDDSTSVVSSEATESEIIEFSANNPMVTQNNEVQILEKEKFEKYPS